MIWIRSYRLISGAARQMATLAVAPWCVLDETTQQKTIILEFQYLAHLI